MSMPIFDRLPLFKLATGCALSLALVACGDSAEDAADAPADAASSGVESSAMQEAEKDATMQAAEDGRIDCAVGGASEYTRNCEVERIADDDGQMLVIRHPDGGFRRFRVLTDGRGLEPAEGFDETSVKILDDQMIEVTSGGDSYRLPAQIKSKPAAPADAAPETGAADKSG